MSASLAELEVDRGDERVVISIRGEIDLSNADAVEREIEPMLPYAKEVLVDLTEVEYMDSQGVRLLYSLSTRLSAHDGRLVVVAPEDTVAGTVLALTQTADLFEIRHVSG